MQYQISLASLYGGLFKSKTHRHLHVCSHLCSGFQVLLKASRFIVLPVAPPKKHRYLPYPLSTYLPRYPTTSP